MGAGLGRNRKPRTEAQQIHVADVGQRTTVTRPQEGRALTTSAQPHTRLHGRLFVIARVTWLAVACLVTVGFVAAVPIGFQELLTVRPNAVMAVGQLRPQDVAAVNQLGLSIGFYAAYFTTLETATALVCAVVAVLIFWRRSDDGMALFVAMTLLLVAPALPVVSALEGAQAAWRPLLGLFRVLFGGSLVPLLFLFPDGHPVPRWVQWLVPVWAGYVLAGLVLPSIWPPLAFGSGLAPDKLLPLAWMLSWLGAGVAAQVYRYYRVSTPTQRQQTKRVVLGLTIFLALFSAGILVLIPQPRDPNSGISIPFRMIGPSLILAGAVALPLSLGLSILRYRLWDIDIIIRRTLVYSVLTSLLALVYLGSVFVLQSLFTALSGQESPVALVLSTLAIAALSVPLRRRVQDGIDRRFYRKKYDAAKVLAAFSATVRGETDLDKLTERLVAVVQETMQPAHVSVWLKPTATRPDRSPRPVRSEPAVGSRETRRGQ